MEIIYIDISELNPYENNPRNNASAVKAVAQSMKEFGFRVPVIIDGEGTVICGHTRIEAAGNLGLKEIPCIIANDLTEEQVRAYRLVDNKTSELSTWDEELLLQELTGIENIDMTDFGFYIDPIEFAELEEDEFKIDLPEEPRSQPGEIYLLGNHRLMCGDSTNPSDVDKLMADAKADLLLTDPPYNVNYCGKAGQGTIENDNLGDEEFLIFLSKAFANADNALKPGGAFYIWHADRETILFRKAAAQVGWQVRQCLIWEKNSFVMGRQDYHWQHEPCLYGWKDGAAHYFTDDRTQSTILKENRPTSSIEHPTMKPVALFGKLIQNSAKTGYIVLDLFGGSGTGLMACEQLNCCCYMMEYDPKYIDVIIDRWEKMTGKSAVLVR